MKTQYYTATSLDGFIATEADSLEWLFALGDVAESSYPAFIADVGAVAMGARTCEWVLDHLEPPAEGGPVEWPYRLPTWIFSHRTLPVPAGADIRFVSGDVSRVHPAMVAAAAGRNIWVAGGGDLAGQFHDAGLLDEVIVQIGSVTLGRGRPLLPRRILAPALRLVSAQQMGPGFVELRYAVSRGS